MTRRQYARRQSRRALIWRVFYGSGELVGQGSIVDVHEPAAASPAVCLSKSARIFGSASGRPTIRPTLLSCRALSGGPEGSNLAYSSTDRCRTLTNSRAREMTTLTLRTLWTVQILRSSL